MEIEYSRKANKNYLVLYDNIESFVEGHDIKMICNNDIKGFLNTKLNYSDIIPRFYYDISAKVTLFQLLEIKNISYEILRGIVIGICEALEQAYKYLLIIDNFVLDNKLIYVSMSTYKSEICYYPYYNKSFENSIQEFHKGLLKYISYNDKEVVKLAYELERMAEENEYNVNGIRRVLANCANTQITPEIKDIEETEIENNTLIEKEEIIEEGLWDKVKKMNFIPKRSRSKEEYKYMPIKTEVEQVVDLREESVNEVMERQMPNDATVCLQQSYEGRLLLFSLDSNYENIIIDKYPCIVGRRIECVDIVLDSKAVSTIHAKIMEKGEKVFITDMNSTNGTYVNEYLLQPYEEVEINDNDIIKLADICFKVD